MERDEQAIRQVVADWMAATQAGDLETILGLMADDVVFLVAGRPPMIGKAAFAAAARLHAGREPPRIDGRSEIQELTIGDDWAYVWTKLTVVMTPPGGGEPITQAGHTLSIFRRQDDRWVLARDANLLSPVAREDRTESS